MRRTELEDCSRQGRDVEPEWPPCTGAATVQQWSTMQRSEGSGSVPPCTSSPAIASFQSSPSRLFRYYIRVCVRKDSVSQIISPMARPLASVTCPIPTSLTPSFYLPDNILTPPKTSIRPNHTTPVNRSSHHCISFSQKSDAAFLSPHPHHPHHSPSSICPGRSCRTTMSQPGWDSARRSESWRSN